MLFILGITYKCWSNYTEKKVSEENQLLKKKLAEAISSQLEKDKKSMEKDQKIISLLETLDQIHKDSFQKIATAEKQKDLALQDNQNLREQVQDLKEQVQDLKEQSRKTSQEKEELKKQSQKSLEIIKVLADQNKFYYDFVVLAKKFVDKNYDFLWKNKINEDFDKDRKQFFLELIDMFKLLYPFAFFPDSPKTLTRVSDKIGHKTAKEICHEVVRDLSLEDSSKDLVEDLVQDEYKYLRPA